MRLLRQPARRRGPGTCGQAVKQLSKARSLRAVGGSQQLSGAGLTALRAGHSPVLGGGPRSRLLLILGHQLGSVGAQLLLNLVLGKPAGTGGAVVGHSMQVRVKRQGSAEGTLGRLGGSGWTRSPHHTASQAAVLQQQVRKAAAWGGQFPSRAPQAQQTNNPPSPPAAAHSSSSSWARITSTASSTSRLRLCSRMSATGRAMVCCSPWAACS